MQPIATGPVGVIMLDTQFPRFIGDIGNPDTWSFQVLYEVVARADPRSVVTDTSSQNLKPYIDAGIALQDRGAVAITTSCGFLALFQNHIATELKVPFVASSLVQVPWVQSLLPLGRSVGIMTIDSDSLTTEHLLAAGIQTNTPVEGTDSEGEFSSAILQNRRTMDRSLCKALNIEAAKRLHEKNPALGAIVLECTNMAPYAHAIHTATQLPVYSIYSLITWLHSGLVPKRFP